MLHVTVQVSPGLGTPSPPSEQVNIPLLGAVSEGQVTKQRENTLVAYENITAW